MRKWTFSALIITTIFCVASNCENPFVEGFYRFYLKNNSKDTISFSYSLNYPDTSIVNIERYNVIRLYPSERAPIDNKKKWEDVINKDIKGKKILIFIFSVVVDDTNWPKVRDNYLVKKRYGITADELKAMNYAISYP